MKNKIEKAVIAFAFTAFCAVCALFSVRSLFPSMAEDGIFFPAMEVVAVLFVVSATIVELRNNDTDGDEGNSFPAGAATANPAFPLPTVPASAPMPAIPTMPTAVPKALPEVPLVERNSGAGDEMPPFPEDMEASAIVDAEDIPLPPPPTYSGAEEDIYYPSEEDLKILDDEFDREFEQCF